MKLVLQVILLVAITTCLEAAPKVMYEVRMKGVYWDQAKANCEKDGGELARAESEAENQAIVNAIAKAGVEAGIWFGLTRTDNAWTWSDGKPLGSWSNWDEWEGQTENAGCAYMMADGLWYRPSDWKKYCTAAMYICQFTTETVVGTRVSACTGDEKLSNGTIITGPSGDSQLVTVRWEDGETASYQYAETCQAKDD